MDGPRPAAEGGAYPVGAVPLKRLAKPARGRARKMAAPWPAPSLSEALMGLRSAVDGLETSHPMIGPYHGRLELTWTNKDQALLWDEGDSYRWVPRSDYRVAEVRLLHDAGVVGEVQAERARAHDNLLIRGDALNALTSLARLPEFAHEYLGKVKLAYLDPPFNTQQAFAHYDDALEHSVWLTMMRDRLVQIKRLLCAEGSIWVHCDDSEQAYLKVAMDEIFGRECFVGTIIWQKADTPRMDAKTFSSSHDYLICYSREPGFRPRRADFKPDLVGYPYTDADGRRYSSLTLRKWGNNSRRVDRPSLWYPIEHKGREYWPVKPDGTDGNWRWSPEYYEANKERVEWEDKGHGLQPYVVTYVSEASTRPYETIWSNEDVGHNREAKAHLKSILKGEPFSTPKPERLLRRVIEIGTEPNEVVLDCFLGSATTATAAHKLGRRWIGIERDADTLTNHALPRLEKVVEGRDPGGISKSVEWRGGGGFRVLDVAPSMFADDGGVVMLANWAVGGQLAQATAAQLGFEFTDDPPFAGRKGRARLAVIDGLVNADVCRLLVDRLEANERLVVCGTAVDPDAQDQLTTMSSGSRVRKIPASILSDYRTRARRVFRTPAPTLDGTGAVDVVAEGVKA